MQRLRARVLLSVFGVSMVAACIIPPEGEPRQEATNYPPEIILSTLFPAEPIFVQNVDEQQGDACDMLIAFDVVDRDNCFVAVRVVADNRRNLVTLIDEDNDVRLAPPGNDACPPQPSYRGRVTKRMNTNDFTPPRVGDPHTISIFVKDTPRDWAVAAEDVGTGDAFLDAGALLPDTPENPRTGSVVSYNWTVVFNQMSCDP